MHTLRITDVDPNKTSECKPLNPNDVQGYSDGTKKSKEDSTTEFNVIDPEDFHDRFNKYQISKINMIKDYIKHKYMEVHVPIPDICIVSGIGWQTTSIDNYSDYTHPGRTSYLLISSVCIRNESLRSMKSDICHEIGHCFAPMIAYKYHLPIENRILNDVYTICYVYRIMTFFMTLMLVSSLTVHMNLFLAFGTVALIIMNFVYELIQKISAQKYQDYGTKEQEYLADEFGLKISHDPQSRFLSFHENHFQAYELWDNMKACDRNALSFKNETRAERKRCIHAMHKDIVEKIKEFKYCWLCADDDHPSDLNRFKRLQWFYNHNMTQWR